MRKSVPRLVVEELGDGLVVATPVGPTQHVSHEHVGGAPEQGDEEAAHLGDADPDQPTLATGSPRLFLNAAREA